MTRLQPERNKALVSRAEGNVIYLDLFDFYPVPVKLQHKTHFTIAGALRWFRRHGVPLPDRLREAGL